MSKENLRLDVKKMSSFDWFSISFLLGALTSLSLSLVIIGMFSGDLLYSLGASAVGFFFALYSIAFYKEYFKPHFQKITEVEQ